MGLRRRLYAGLFDVLGPKGLSAFYASKFAGIGVIFMYHRILRPGEVSLYPGYAVSTDELDICLRTVRAAGWKIASIDEMHAALRAGGADHRLACFTFDDGYEDNYTAALPVFQMHGASMCVYVSTGLIDRTMFFWWGALEQMILERQDLDLDLPNDPMGPRRVQLRTFEEKLAGFRAVDGWCHANGSLAERALRDLFDANSIDPLQILDRHALTRQQLTDLSRDPLVTIGSHTVSHRRLILLSDGELTCELTASRRTLEEWTGSEVRHLAYPFGSPNACGPREYAAAEASGYATAVTTRRGNIFAMHRERLMSLPRRAPSVSASEVRNALYGVSSILRHESVVAAE
jgi:peptidoglycan/xylan/chitin deacetylase (PgdA/CDA1 family)